LSGPLFPSRLVGQHLDEDASHHGARLKGAVFSRIGVAEIGERKAVGGFVGELVRRRKKTHEIGLVVRKRGCPEEPVQFGVQRSGVKRQTVSILLGLVT